jgi:uncharacterized BrkB/YihY/UPF0761 family membrane protein
MSVACWVGLSYVLGIYFRNFAHFNKTYGAVGAVIGLMVWLYWNGFVMLLGAELNCELAKETKAGKIAQDAGQERAYEARYCGVRMNIRATADARRGSGAQVK